MLEAPPFRIARVAVSPGLLAAAIARADSGAAHRVAKPGGRSELALPLDAPGLADLLHALGRSPRDLVFASLLVAHRGHTAHQPFHSDGDGSDALASRALVYLSDVAGPDDGAIEFAGAEAVVGACGTAVSYAASALHRGRANAAGRADRLAIGLAFSRTGALVETIGGGGGGGDGEPLTAEMTLCTTVVCCPCSSLLALAIFPLALYFYCAVLCADLIRDTASCNGLKRTRQRLQSWRTDVPFSSPAFVLLGSAAASLPRCCRGYQSQLIISTRLARSTRLCNLSAPARSAGG